MTNPRVRKIADRIQVIVAEMMERRIKDPRLGFATITDVRVTGDTQQATVFYTVLGDDDVRPGRHRRGPRVGQGADPLRGRQAAGHAARAPRSRSSPTPCPRPPVTSTRSSSGRGSPTRRSRRAARARRTPATRTPTRSPSTTRTSPRRSPPGPMADAVSGLVVVDKPGGVTSHDVVARVRRLAGTRKVGHAGTLDPMATGVLVLGVNRATRLLGHLMLTEKAYDATIRLGVATTTDDAEGEVLASVPASGLDERGGPRRAGDVRRRDRPGALGGVGDQGRREARLRRGCEPARTSELEARRVTIDELLVHDARAGSGDDARRAGVRALLERHLHPRPGPRPRRDARRRRPPHRAAPDRRRRLRPRRGADPRAAGRRVRDGPTRGRGPGELPGRRPGRRRRRVRPGGPASPAGPRGRRAGRGLRPRRGVPRALRATRRRGATGRRVRWLNVAGFRRARVETSRGGPGRSGPHRRHHRQLRRRPPRPPARRTPGA